MEPSSPVSLLAVPGRTPRRASVHFADDAKPNVNANSNSDVALTQLNSSSSANNQTTTNNNNNNKSNNGSSHMEKTMEDTVQPFTADSVATTPNSFLPSIRILDTAFTPNGTGQRESSASASSGFGPPSAGNTLTTTKVSCAGGDDITAASVCCDGEGNTASQSDAAVGPAIIPPRAPSQQQLNARPGSGSEFVAWTEQTQSGLEEVDFRQATTHRPPAASFSAINTSRKKLTKSNNNASPTGSLSSLFPTLDEDLLRSLPFSILRPLESTGPSTDLTAVKVLRVAERVDKVVAKLAMDNEESATTLGGLAKTEKSRRAAPQKNNSKGNKGNNSSGFTPPPPLKQLEKGDSSLPDVAHNSDTCSSSFPRHGQLPPRGQQRAPTVSTTAPMRPSDRSEATNSAEERRLALQSGGGEDSETRALSQLEEDGHQEGHSSVTHSVEKNFRARARERRAAAIATQEEQARAHAQTCERCRRRLNLGEAFVAKKEQERVARAAGGIRPVTTPRQRPPSGPSCLMPHCLSSGDEEQLHTHRDSALRSYPSPYRGYLEGGYWSRRRHNGSAGHSSDDSCCGGHHGRWRRNMDGERDEKEGGVLFPIAHRDHYMSGTNKKSILVAADSTSSSSPLINSDTANHSTVAVGPPPPLSVPPSPHKHKDGGGASNVNGSLLAPPEGVALNTTYYDRYGNRHRLVDPTEAAARAARRRENFKANYNACNRIGCGGYMGECGGIFYIDKKGKRHAHCPHRRSSKKLKNSIDEADSESKSVASHSSSEGIDEEAHRKLFPWLNDKRKNDKTWHRITASALAANNRLLKERDRGGDAGGRSSSTSPNRFPHDPEMMANRSSSSPLRLRSTAAAQQGAAGVNRGTFGTSKRFSYNGDELFTVGKPRNRPEPPPRSRRVVLRKRRRRTRSSDGFGEADDTDSDAFSNTSAFRVRRRFVSRPFRENGRRSVFEPQRRGGAGESSSSSHSSSHERKNDSPQQKRRSGWNGSTVADQLPKRAHSITRDPSNSNRTRQSYRNRSPSTVGGSSAKTKTPRRGPSAVDAKLEAARQRRSKHTSDWEKSKQQREARALRKKLAKEKEEAELLAQQVAAEEAERLAAERAAQLIEAAKAKRHQIEQLDRKILIHDYKSKLEDFAMKRAELRRRHSTLSKQLEGAEPANSAVLRELEQRIAARRALLSEASNATQSAKVAAEGARRLIFECGDECEALLKAIRAARIDQITNFVARGVIAPSNVGGGGSSPNDRNASNPTTTANSPRRVSFSSASAPHLPASAYTSSQVQSTMGTTAMRALRSDTNPLQVDHRTTNTSFALEQASVDVVLAEALKSAGSAALPSHMPTTRGKEKGPQQEKSNKNKNNSDGIHDDGAAVSVVAAALPPPHRSALQKKCLRQGHEWAVAFLDAADLVAIGGGLCPLCVMADEDEKEGPPHDNIHFSKTNEEEHTFAKTVEGRRKSHQQHPMAPSSHGGDSSFGSSRHLSLHQGRGSAITQPNNSNSNSESDEGETEYRTDALRSRRGGDYDTSSSSNSGSPYRLRRRREEEGEDFSSSSASASSSSEASATLIDFIRSGAEPSTRRVHVNEKKKRNDVTRKSKGGLEDTIGLSSDNEMLVRRRKDEKRRRRNNNKREEKKSPPSAPLARSEIDERVNSIVQNALRNGGGIAGGLSNEKEGNNEATQRHAGVATSNRVVVPTLPPKKSSPTRGLIRPSAGGGRTHHPLQHVHVQYEQKRDPSFVAPLISVFDTSGIADEGEGDDDDEAGANSSNTNRYAQEGEGSARTTGGFLMGAASGGQQKTLTPHNNNNNNNNNKIASEPQRPQNGNLTGLAAEMLGPYRRQVLQALIFEASRSRAEYEQWKKVGSVGALLGKQKEATIRQQALERDKRMRETIGYESVSTSSRAAIVSQREERGEEDASADMSTSMLNATQGPAQTNSNNIATTTAGKLSSSQNADATSLLEAVRAVNEVTRANTSTTQKAARKGFVASSPEDLLVVQSSNDLHSEDNTGNRGHFRTFIDLSVWESESSCGSSNEEEGGERNNKAISLKRQQQEQRSKKWSSQLKRWSRHKGNSKSPLSKTTFSSKLFEELTPTGQMESAAALSRRRQELLRDGSLPETLRFSRTVSPPRGPSSTKAARYTTCTDDTSSSLSVQQGKATDFGSMLDEIRPADAKGHFSQPVPLKPRAPTQPSSAPAAAVHRGGRLASSTSAPPASSSDTAAAVVTPSSSSSLPLRLREKPHAHSMASAHGGRPINALRAVLDV